SRRRHTRFSRDWSSDVCSSDLVMLGAMERHGKPEIFNTDQGSQFTSSVFIEALKKHEVKISMDGKGRALDNIYIERFWGSLKRKIGRASCRERAEMWEGAGTCE